MTIMYMFYDLNSFFYCNDKNWGERITYFNSEAEQMISGQNWKSLIKIMKPIIVIINILKMQFTHIKTQTDLFYHELKFIFNSFFPIIMK